MARLTAGEEEKCERGNERQTKENLANCLMNAVFTDSKRATTNTNTCFTPSVHG